MNDKLKTKDFITIGIFSAIYVVGTMVLVTISGITPITYLFASTISSLLLAPIYFLFVARTKKKNAVLIFGVIVGIVFGMMMMSYWLVIPTTIIGVLLAEFFARRAEFKRFGTLVVSYVCFSLWSLGVFSTFFVFKDKFLLDAAQYYDARQVTLMEQVLNQPLVLVAVYVLAIVGAIIGAYISKSLLNKHFKKAGIA